jgi:hypothetical protein
MYGMNRKYAFGKSPYVTIVDREQIIGCCPFRLCFGAEAFTSVFSREEAWKLSVVDLKVETS